RGPALAGPGARPGARRADPHRLAAVGHRKPGGRERRAGAGARGNAGRDRGSRLCRGAVAAQHPDHHAGSRAESVRRDPQPHPLQRPLGWTKIARFLLSCRALGWDVETAACNHISHSKRAFGLSPELPPKSEIALSRNLRIAPQWCNVVQTVKQSIPSDLCLDAVAKGRVSRGLSEPLLVSRLQPIMNWSV